MSTTTIDIFGTVSERTKQVRVVAQGGGGTATNQPPEASFVFFPAGPTAGSAPMSPLRSPTVVCET